MAITVVSTAPTTLLANIKEQIDDKEIRTWSYDQDGDFTHTPPQWKDKAWLRPKIVTGKLILNILPPSKTKLSAEVYAVYHGRFIEMLLEHFDKEFPLAWASAMPETDDVVG